MVHEPKKDYGLDIPDIYIHQGTQHMEFYINNIFDKTSILGGLQRTFLE